MNDLKPMTSAQMLTVMLVESQNELQKTQIMERLAQRERLRGTKVDMMLGQIQGKIKSLQKTITDLQTFQKEELAKNSESVTLNP